MTFNIYVPSYNRWDAIKTAKQLDYCTYVVRKSQEQAYRDAGIESILAVDDDEICSLQKVTNWIIEKTPEDVVALLDDDVYRISYRLDGLTVIEDPKLATMELERLAQCLVDLNIGYCASPASSRAMYYEKPFRFTGTTGGMKIFNKACCKTRWSELLILSDMEFELEELLYNRIILIPDYFCDEHNIDTNAGGNNTIKSNGLVERENEILTARFGKYWTRRGGGANGEGGAGRLMVKR